MPDAITSLREDHRKVEKLFKEFEKLHKNDGTAKQKRTVVEQIINELAIHATVEEQVFYPAVRQAVEDAEETVLEGLEEHHIVKWTLSELTKMTGEEERFDAKMMVLMESVRHHVEEEEGEMFPKVREALGRKALVELYDTMEQCRTKAPDQPRPMAPDEPATPPPMPPSLSETPASSSNGGARTRSGLLGRRRAKAGTKS
jgi:hemerythrin superfamily protein